MTPPLVHDDMVRIPRGTFAMGSDDFYPDERPVHERTVEEFELDRYPVTNADFAAFVADTGYVTVAERPLDPPSSPISHLMSSRRARWCSPRRAARSTCRTGARGGAGSRARRGATPRALIRASTTGCGIR